MIKLLFIKNIYDVKIDQPVPRGLEIKIAEKMERLRQLDEQAGKKDT
ncbi:hypothetical protein [Alcaligenes faecalis]|nr:hypothetical protein [Alcaligenes faecalis]